MYLRVWGKGKKMLFKQIETIDTIETRGRKFIVDQNIKICEQCDRLWEKLNKRIHTIPHTFYPPGVIPRIGKGRKICPLCEKRGSK